MSVFSRLGLVGLAVAAVAAVSGCTADPATTDAGHDTGDKSSSGKDAAAFAVPKSCDSIDMAGLGKRLVGGIHAKVDDKSHKGKMFCSYTATRRSVEYGVYVQVTTSDCVKSRGAKLTCDDVPASECSPSKGSKKYGGLSCFGRDEGVLEYELPGIEVFVNTKATAHDTRDYFEQWATAVSAAAAETDQ